jgi:hypothetical protein
VVEVVSCFHGFPTELESFVSNKYAFHGERCKMVKGVLCAYLRCSKSSSVKEKDILTNFRGEVSWVKR